MTYNATARRMYPEAEWVKGDGPYAILAHCPPLTVTLWRTRTEADDALAFIDQTGCGGGCTGRHEATTCI